MRVVAGIARGRRLVAPDGTDTRPTSDRVRESIFNMLASLDALGGATVLDLYAGSGALGIEALSRGAEQAVLVDSDRAAIQAIETNVATCDFADETTIECVEASRYLGRATPVDLAFLDPPYEFDGWAELLDRVPAALVVIESDRAIDPGAGWQELRSRRYGSTVVTIARRVDAPQEEADS